MRVLAVASLLAMVGCGARVDDAAASDSGVDAGGDGAITTDAAACPAALPATGATCSASATTTCTYGGVDRLPWCRPRATCSGGAWSVVDWKCPACPTTVVSQAIPPAASHPLS